MGGRGAFYGRHKPDCEDWYRAMEETLRRRFSGLKRRTEAEGVRASLTKH